MNNYKKIGLTALAGSLAMVSANAVEYTMSGGLMSVYTTQDNPAAAESVNGKGLTTATDLTFNASGELDNGFTVSYMMALDTDTAVSNTSSQLTVGMGSLGTLQVNNKGGSAANGIDDVTPHAYNETWDGLSTVNPSTFGSRTSSGSLDYRIPAQEMMGLTINASVTLDPNAGVTSATKGGVSATTVKGTAYTASIAHGSGLTVGGGVEEVEDDSGLLLASGTTETTGYVKYAMGGLSAAYQEAYTNSVNGTGTEGADVETSFWGVAYTAGDFTVSYAESTSQTSAVSDTAQTLESELDSLQIAYVVGAMTISGAMSETANPAGTTTVGTYEENTLAVTFAF
jgi:outer membrane protein OmpU